MALLAGIGWWLAHPEPAPPPPTAEEVAHATATFEKVTDEADQVAAEARKGHVRPFRFRLSQADVNGILAGDDRVKTALSQRHVYNPYVRIRNGVMDATVTSVKGGVPLTATAVLSVRTTPEGNLAVQVDRLHVGRIPVSPAEANVLVGRLVRSAAEKRLSSHVALTQVSVSDGAVVIQGQGRP